MRIGDFQHLSTESQSTMPKNEKGHIKNTVLFPGSTEVDGLARTLKANKPMRQLLSVVLGGGLNDMDSGFRFANESSRCAIGFLIQSSATCCQS